MQCVIHADVQIVTLVTETLTTSTTYVCSAGCECLHTSDLHAKVLHALMHTHTHAHTHTYTRTHAHTHSLCSAIGQMYVVGPNVCVCTLNSLCQIPQQATCHCHQLHCKCPCEEERAREGVTSYSAHITNKIKQSI